MFLTTWKIKIKKMIIGISIDGVLRDLFGKIEETHDKYFSSEDKEPIVVVDYDLEKWITFPEEETQQSELGFDPNFNETDFIESEKTTELVSTKTTTTIDEFLYEKCALEIFGYANESVSSAMETLNQLIIDNPEHEFIIISREGGLAVPSTLFFLSKNKCTCPNIKFVKEYSKVWDYVDVMVTDHPKIINNKLSISKINIVIDKDFNKKTTQSCIRIKSIKEIDSDFLKKVNEERFN